MTKEQLVGGGFNPVDTLSSWWLNHPSEKNARQNGNLPQGSG